MGLLFVFLKEESKTGNKKLHWFVLHSSWVTLYNNFACACWFQKIILDVQKQPLSSEGQYGVLILCLDELITFGCITTSIVVREVMPNFYSWGNGKGTRRKINCLILEIFLYPPRNMSCHELTGFLKYILFMIAQTWLQRCWTWTSWVASSFRFFKIVLETIKRKSAKMASFTEVSTRKATRKDLDGDGDKVQKSITWNVPHFPYLFLRTGIWENIACFDVNTSCVNTKLLLNQFLYV